MPILRNKQTKTELLQLSLPSLAAMTAVAERSRSTAVFILWDAQVCTGRGAEVWWLALHRRPSTPGRGACRLLTAADGRELTKSFQGAKHRVTVTLPVVIIIVSLHQLDSLRSWLSQDVMSWTPRADIDMKVRRPTSGKTSLCPVCVGVRRRACMHAFERPCSNRKITLRQSM